MKNIIRLAVAIVLILSSCEQASQGFDISGTVKGVEDGKAFVVTKILNNKGGDTLAVGELKNGYLSIIGRTDFPQLVRIKFESRPKLSRFEMVIENQHYFIETNVSQTNFPVIVGGNYHQQIFREHCLDKDYMNFFTHYNHYNVNYSKFKKLNDTINYRSESKKRSNEWKQAYKRMRQVSKELFATSSDPLAKALILEQQGIPIFMEDLNQTIIENICSGLTEYPFHRQLIANLYNSYVEVLIAEERTGKGKHFTDFVAYDCNNQPVKLSEVVKKNKLVMLEFWASWCGPCKKEIPNLKEAYKKYHKHGFEIYSISIDAKIKDWHRVSEEHELPWVSCLQKLGTKEVEKLYGITGVPASFLITQEGIIINSGRELRGSKLDPLLKKILIKV